MSAIRAAHLVMEQKSCTVKNIENLLILLFVKQSLINIVLAMPVLMMQASVV